MLFASFIASLPLGISIFRSIIFSTLSPATPFLNLPLTLLYLTHLLLTLDCLIPPTPTDDIKTYKGGDTIDKMSGGVWEWGLGPQLVLAVVTTHVAVYATALRNTNSGRMAKGWRNAVVKAFFITMGGFGIR